MLQSAIAGAPAGIEAEFARTANTWPSCVGSRVFVIDTYLSIKSVEDALGPVAYQAVMKRMDRLQERLAEVKAQYPTKVDQPPEEVKHELLTLLDVLNG